MYVDLTWLYLFIFLLVINIIVINKNKLDSIISMLNGKNYKSINSLLFSQKTHIPLGKIYAHLLHYIYSSLWLHQPHRPSRKMCSRLWHCIHSSLLFKIIHRIYEIHKLLGKKSFLWHCEQFSSLFIFTHGTLCKYISFVLAHIYH